MKNFFLFTTALSVTASLILALYLNYSLVIILYHLLLMLLLNAVMLVLNLAVGAVWGNKKPGAVVMHLLNGSFFFFLFLFYLLVLGSNFFWKKTITFSILKNYLLSLNQFIEIMPVERWIIVVAAIVLFTIIAILFLSLKPGPTQVYKSYQHLNNPLFRKRFALAAGLFLFTLVLFNRPLFAAKRVMHFAEEPLLQFVFGGIWGGENTLAFDKVRYENGLRDQACTEAVKANTQNDRTIIIILIDALRNDHLPVYGYARKTTPFIDSLYTSKNLHVVKNAFSTSTMTIGGISGLFFSKDWNEFGFNGLSLMKFLKKSGYHTYAFLTGFHRDWYGLSALYRGNCDYYYESLKSPDDQGDNDLVTLNEFKKTPLQKKSFAYIHLLSTHTLGKKSSAFRIFRPDKIGVGADKKTALINNYDNGVLQADYVVREVFNKLKNENLLDNATVFIVADHGEMFGENGAWGHGGNIQENLLSIPLLVYDKEKSWYQNSEAATLKDIAPTIAERINSPVPDCWEGTSLHHAPHDFTIAVESVEKCEFPYGILNKTGDMYELKILNEKRQLHQTVFKTANRWQTTDSITSR